MHALGPSMSTLLRILLSLITAFVAVPLARAQSEAALAGMQAYNKGDYAAAYRLLRQSADASDPQGLVNSSGISTLAATACVPISFNHSAYTNCRPRQEAVKE